MKSKGVPALIPFLIVISAIFIGILIWAYVETKKANPQMIQVGQSCKHCSELLDYAGPANNAGRSAPVERASGPAMPAFMRAFFAVALFDERKNARMNAGMAGWKPALRVASRWLARQ
jgi:hypothetical protein